MSTFVLVHGAWHGGWCWQKVAPLLRTSGNSVYTPTLTGLGDRSHLLRRGINLDTHVKDVVNLLQFEDLRDVILVGHSYSGMVIVGAADAVPQRLSHLVYLDAVTPSDGQSLFEFVGRKMENDLRRLVDGEGGWLLRPDPRHAFGITDKEDAKWVKERVTPQPIATCEQKVRFRNSSALAIPKTLIWCSGGSARGRQRRDVRDDWPSLPATFPGGWGFYEIKTGHDAMITAPSQLAEILKAVASSSIPMERNEKGQ